MSCYFRHLKEIFGEAGVEVTPGNKKTLDQAIHRIVDIDYKNCSDTWQKVKQNIMAGEQKRREFIEKLRGAVS